MSLTKTQRFVVKYLGLIVCRFQAQLSPFLIMFWSPLELITYNIPGPQDFCSGASGGMLGLLGYQQSLHPQSLGDWVKLFHPSLGIRHHFPCSRPLKVPSSLMLLCIISTIPAARLRGAVVGGMSCNFEN